MNISNWLIGGLLYVITTLIGGGMGKGKHDPLWARGGVFWWELDAEQKGGYVCASGADEIETGTIWLLKLNRW